MLASLLGLEPKWETEITHHAVYEVNLNMPPELTKACRLFSELRSVLGVELRAVSRMLCRPSSHGLSWQRDFHALLHN